MKTLRVWALVFFVLFAFSMPFMLMGCGDDESTTTEPEPEPEVPDCEKRHTATVTFENKSATSKTYDVIWDGSRRTVLAAGEKSNQYTVKSGKHTLQFMVSNTNTAACSQSTPVLEECSSHNYWCTN